MGTMRRRLLAVAGVAVGIIMVRRFRQRRSISTESRAVQRGHSDADTAIDHAVAATEHARLATKKATNIGVANSEPER